MRGRGVPGLVPAPPRPGEFDHADLLPAVARLVGRDVGRVDADEIPPQLTRSGLRGVVVLVVDGLGWHQLHATSAAPFLSSVATEQDQPGHAVLPSTTTSNLASIGTGRTSGAHGILGYTMLLDGELFNALVWRDGLRGGGRDVRDQVVPEVLVPAPTMLELLAADGVVAGTVLDPKLLDSGLTRAGLRGGQRLAAAGLAATVEAAVELVSATTEPAVVYAHHPDVDTAGHLHGPHTPPWEATLGAVDRTLASLVPSLSDDVAVVVTADHGMVAIDDADCLDLHDDDALLDGVRVVAGEPRMRVLGVGAGIDPAAVAARFAEARGDEVVARTTADAVAEGWFGPDVPANHAARLGDVLVASVVGGLPHPRVDPHGGHLPGMHGSITAAERDVPLLVLTSDLG